MTRRIATIASALSSDARNAARLARQFDFDGLLFEARTRELVLAELSSTGQREFLRVLSSENVALVGLRFDLGPSGLAGDPQRAIDHLDHVMRASADLSAPLVCVDLGPLPAPQPSAPRPAPTITPELAGLLTIPPSAPAPQAPPPEPTAADRALADRAREAMAHVCALADRYSVTLAARSDLASFASLEQVLREASCPWLGVDLDPVAMLRDDWASDEIFSQLGPLIRHVRVRDAALGADRRTRPAAVGKGSTDWTHLMRNLDGSAYAGWLTIDPLELPDRRAGATAGVYFLRKTSE